MARLISIRRVFTLKGSSSGFRLLCRIVPYPFHSLVGSLSRGGRLDEIVDAEVVFAGVLEDGEALAAHVLLRGRDPQICKRFFTV